MSASIDGGAGDVRAFLRQQRENLDRTLEGLDVDAFEAAVVALANARRVLIHGKGAAACVAELLRFRLRRYGLAVELLPAGGSELMEGLVHAREGDVLVAFGFQRVPAEDQALLDFGAKAGCTTLLFTDRIVRSGGDARARYRALHVSWRATRVPLDGKRRRPGGRARSRGGRALGRRRARRT